MYAFFSDQRKNDFVIFCFGPTYEVGLNGWAGHMARMGKGRSVLKVLVGKHDGKRTFERTMRRWEDGIKMELREIIWGCVESIHLAQDRGRWRAVVNAVMNLRVLAPRSYLWSRTVPDNSLSCSHFKVKQNILK
jgi:hypothetical protein